MKYDQHFLEDNSILSLEIDSINISSETIILEIGPGNGSLTKRILQNKPKKLISVEIDKDLVSNLKELEELFENFEVVHGNILDYIDNFNFNLLVGNIPYSLTEPIYVKVLQRLPEEILFIHGLNFYNTLMKRKNSQWHYFIRSQYEISLISEIPGSFFSPPTKVKSALIKLVRKKELTAEDKFYNTLFLKRERKVLNALQFSLVDTFSMSKKEALFFLQNLPCRELLYQDKAFKNLSNIEFRELLSQVFKNIRI